MQTQSTSGLGQMKLIFLDVDGVLNTMKSITQAQDIHHIEPSCLNNLKRIVDETDAQIVISSSWRFHADGMDVLYSKLESVGLKNRVIGSTPYVHGPRGREILKWLQDNNHTEAKYVVLDDDMIHRDYKGDGEADPSLQNMRSLHIKTHSSHGLTEREANQAIKKLIN
jgi:hypothetical protein